MSTAKMRSVVGRILRENFNEDNEENLAELNLVKQYIFQLEKENARPSTTGTPNKVVSDALAELNNSFNRGSEDSAYNLSLVEQHIEQLEAKTDPIALGNDALYLHCFATEVLKQLPESTGDLFGIGEDYFIVLLYPFAEMISHTKDKAEELGLHFQGVFVYDCMEELAGLFIATIMRQKIEVCAAMAYELPELDEFELDVVRVVASHAR